MKERECKETQNETKREKEREKESMNEGKIEKINILLFSFSKNE
jgi:hypothetical protein